jgi:RNase H-like domain found in reverse transcriptase
METFTQSHTSRQLKEHEKNYSPFLLEAAATVWGMDNFNKYLGGTKFTLYADYKPLEQMGHLHSKTFNQLQMALMEHNFIMQNRQTANLPSHLKLAKADLTQNISNTHLHVSTQIYKPGQPSNDLTNLRQPPTKILSQISQPQTQTST